MRLSFVILTRNSERYIDACLSSLEASLGGISYEILIVDNGSSDRTLEIISSHRGVQVLRLEENWGTTFSRNLALKHAAGDYIVVMDSDIEIRRLDWEKLLSKFCGHLGMIAPRLFLPDGRVQHSVKKFPLFHWRLAKLRKIFFGLAVKEREHYSDLSVVESPDTAISAFWVLSREAMRAVGLFDEKIFYSPEDLDYCVRLWGSGFSIKYYRDADIVHHTQQVAHKKPFSLISLSFFLNFLYYFWKHKYWFDSKIVDEIKASVLRE